MNGDPINITDAPYQVALVPHNESAPASFCGGSITTDRRHIITAAHCVFGNPWTAPGQPIAPSALDVVAGTSQLFGYDGGGTRIFVTDVSLDDDYDPATLDHDAALLTLSGSLPLTAKIAPISLAEQLDASATSATVTGWGQTRAGLESSNPSDYPQTLRAAPIAIHSDSACAQYAWFDIPTMICAGDSNHDACFGDSGGPLVVPGDIPPDKRLLGIVSWGPPEGCAIAGRPAGYTDVSDEATGNYLKQSNPASAPRTVAPPSVQGTVAVGSTVTCDKGSWQGANVRFSYQFVAPTAGGDVARTAQGTQDSYVIQPGDAGGALRCDVKGVNDGGLAFASSASVTVPVPASPTPPQQTPPPSNPPPPTQNQQDSAAPVARVVKTSCTSTRCTLTVSVSDAGFSAGIRTVKATVRSTYRTTCTRKGKKVACTKRKNGKTSVTALGPTRFRVVASKLPVGRQVFTLIAVDKAGHRQTLPTTKTVTTKKPKKKRR